MPDNLTKFHASKFSLFLALSATLLTFIVIGLGAYTRLTDAGLGCPDWPGCYGQWFLDPKAIADPAFNSKKAWTEMIHRYMAGSLGILIFGLAILTIKKSNRTRRTLGFPIALVILLIFQALLGMWTVTLKLFPVVVMAHLLGGMTTLVLLWWYALKLLPPLHTSFKKESFKKLRRWGLVALVTLGVQLLLGGWTSANYAALVCLDFPSCQMPADFRFNFFETFHLGASVSNSTGEPLNLNARISIQLLHRIGALLTFLSVSIFALSSWHCGVSRYIRMLSLLTLSLLVIQVLLGISNVLLLLPLKVAVAHNCTAAALLLCLITLFYYLNTSILYQRDENA